MDWDCIWVWLSINLTQIQFKWVSDYFVNIIYEVKKKLQRWHGSFHDWVDNTCSMSRVEMNEISIKQTFFSRLRDPPIIKLVYEEGNDVQKG